MARPLTRQGAQVWAPAEEKWSDTEYDSDGIAVGSDSDSDEESEWSEGELGELQEDPEELTLRDEWADPDCADAVGAPMAKRARVASDPRTRPESCGGVPKVDASTFSREQVFALWKRATAEARASFLLQALATEPDQEGGLREAAAVGGGPANP